MTCPECGLPLKFLGEELPHTPETHQYRRTALYGAFRWLLDRETDRRLKGAETGVQGLREGAALRAGYYHRIWRTLGAHVWRRATTGVQ